jgi:hypothetical protein
MGEGEASPVAYANPQDEPSRPEEARSSEHRRPHEAVSAPEAALVAGEDEAEGEEGIEGASGRIS